MLIRPAIPEDAFAVAHVHVRSWQAAYRSLLPAEYLDGLRAEDRAARYDFSHSDPRSPHTLVAELDGSIGGFVTTMASRDQSLSGSGELCALYDSPSLWGCGMGVALIEAARARLVAQGYSSAMLWLLKGNARADRFYRRDEWLPDGEQKPDRVWGVDIEEFRYVRGLP